MVLLPYDSQLFFTTIQSSPRKGKYDILVLELLGKIVIVEFFYLEISMRLCFSSFKKSFTFKDRVEKFHSLQWLWRLLSSTQKFRKIVKIVNSVLTKFTKIVKIVTSVQEKPTNIVKIVLKVSHAPLDCEDC